MRWRPGYFRKELSSLAVTKIYIYKKKGFSDTLVDAVLKQLYTQEPATFDSSD